MRILTMVFAAAMTVCGLASAQTLPDEVTVHFATPVMVGETAMPAGDCHIRVLRSSDNVLLEIRSVSNPGNAVLVQVNRVVDSRIVVDGSASVTLSRHNDVYRLDKVVLADHTGFQLLDSPNN